MFRFLKPYVWTPNKALEARGIYPLGLYREKGQSLASRIKVTIVEPLLEACVCFMTRPIFGRRNTPFASGFHKTVLIKQRLRFFVRRLSVHVLSTDPCWENCRGGPAGLGLRFHFSEAGARDGPLFHRESGRIVCHLLSCCLVTDFWHMPRAICT